MLLNPLHWAFKWQQHSSSWGQHECVRKILTAVLAVVFVEENYEYELQGNKRRKFRLYPNLWRLSSRELGSVCKIKWWSVQFCPLDKSHEAECVIFLIFYFFRKKKTCRGCVCDPPQQAEAFVGDVTRSCVRRMPLGLPITHRPCHSGSEHRHKYFQFDPSWPSWAAGGQTAGLRQTQDVNHSRWWKTPRLARFACVWTRQQLEGFVCQKRAPLGQRWGLLWSVKMVLSCFFNKIHPVSSRINRLTPIRLIFQRTPI